MANTPKKYANLITLQKLVEKIKELFATKSDLSNGLAGKADSSHVHSIANITNLQYSLDGKVPTSRTINNKSLTSNITLSASDVGAAPSSHSHNDLYYTETEIDTKLSAKSDSTHKHDSDYDAKGASDTALVSAKSYTDTKTANLASTSVVDTKISTHNTSASAHNDIRDLISGLTTRLNTLANSDDTTLDQMSEIVAYIKNNKGLIDGITTSKVNVSDIINNLTTNVSNKPLSAAQGVAIKALIDELGTALDGKADSSHNHSAANITSGTLSSDRLPTIPITKGGTGATTAAGVLTNLGITATAAELNKLDGVTATATELNYVDGVTSNIQTQLDSKQATITGGASTITSSNLTANRALVSNGSGKVAVSAVTSTELGHLDGVTSNVQVQLDNKADKNHNHSWNDLQNKPFGDETESEETLMLNKTISMYGDGWYRVTPVVELVEGATYKVTFNGVAYESIAWVSPATGTICIGNGEIYGGEDYGNWSAPFAFEYANGTFNLYSNDIGSATFSIVKVVADVTKLDDRFIPDTIARTSAVSQVQIITWEEND